MAQLLAGPRQMGCGACAWNGARGVHLGALPQCINLIALAFLATLLLQPRFLLWVLITLERSERTWVPLPR